jgi:hypothetical protein
MTGKYLDQFCEARRGQLPVSFEREGRVVGADIQWATRETIQAVWRDFFSDFARQTVAGVRSSALVRDQDKLEVLDESIDREAIVHINNFVFRDKLSPEQITKLKWVFSAYQDIFIVDAWQAGIDASTTYKDMVGWLNYMQRKMKNHVVFMPKQDFKYEAKGGVRYDLKQTWSDNLKQSYSCVIAAGWLNCNPSYGKTSGLRKEFEKGAGKNIKVTLNKFKKSFEKLDMLLKKGDKSEHFWGYFEWNASERGLNYQGPEKSTKQINAAQDAREEKIQMQDLLDECYKKAQKNPDKYIVTIEKYKVEGSDFLPEGGMGISFSCREKSPYEYADPGKLTEAEKSRVITMQTNMNEFITLILALDETNEAMAVLSAPMDVTKEFPKLSKAVYDTKATIRELNKHSIESCLAFCSNLNGRVNCGKQ